MEDSLKVLKEALIFLQTQNTMIRKILNQKQYMMLIVKNQ